MRIALIGYAVVYGLAISVTILDDLKSKRSLWDTASDVVLLPLGWVGILLCHFGVANPRHQIDMEGGCPSHCRWADRGGASCSSPLPPREGANTGRDGRSFADVFTFLLLVPMFMINLAFAFR